METIQTRLIDAILATNPKLERLFCDFTKAKDVLVAEPLYAARLKDAKSYLADAVDKALDVPAFKFADKYRGTDYVKGVNGKDWLETRNCQLKATRRSSRSMPICPKCKSAWPSQPKALLYGKPSPPPSPVLSQTVRLRRTPPLLISRIPGLVRSAGIDKG